MKYVWMMALYALTILLLPVPASYAEPWQPSALPAPRHAPPLPSRAAPVNQQEEFHWKKVGGDPCNPKAGCTLDWALSQVTRHLGWPHDAVVRLREQILNTQPGSITLVPGWRGWMTWGKFSPKFRARVVADWPAGQREAATHWSIVYGGVAYHVVKVRTCGNWGGWTEVAPQAPPAIPLKPRLPDGIPTFGCPDV